MRTLDEYAYLTAATRARTVLHSRCRNEAARLAPGSPGPAAPGSPTFSVALLDDGRGLYAVHHVSGAPVSRLQVVCRSDVPGLGVQRLAGDTGAPLRPDEAAALGVGPGLGTAVVVPIRLDTARLLVPATRSRRAHAVHVDPDAFSRAVHDPWVLAGPGIGPEVERRHQDRLLRLVGADRACGADGAVVVRRIRTHALDVTWLGADGVTDVSLPFPRPVADLDALESWLMLATG